MDRILMDTGPLVALFSERDPLRPAAQAGLDRAKRAPIVCLPVLTEALHFISSPASQRRLRLAFEDGILEFGGPNSTAGEASLKALAWMEHYAEHAPDFVDAYLIAWAETESFPVWTFDSEFTTTWRTSKGRRVRLFK